MNIHQQFEYHSYDEQQQQQHDQPIPILLSNMENFRIGRKKSQSNASRTRNYSDTDSSYVPETTSESGISDLDMSEKCNCCPYGFHIDTDFVNFLETLDGKNLIKQLKKIQRKRNERLQRSMEYVIDEVEKIRQLNEEYDFPIVQPKPQYISPSLPQKPVHIPVQPMTPPQTSFRRIEPSPSRSLVSEQLKRTINKIDQEIDREFDPYKAKYLIEQRIQSRHASVSPVRLINQNSPRNKQRAASIDIKYSRRSRSGRRSKSHSKSPLTTMTPGGTNEQMIISNDDIIQTTTTTTYHQIPQQRPYYEHVLPSLIDQPTKINNPLQTSQEVTLNLVSLTQNKLETSDSSSSESLCSSYDGVKCLKINEDGTLKKKPVRFQTQVKIPITGVNTTTAELYRRIEELERKLSKLPELEISNSVLMEERNQLIRQLSLHGHPSTIQRDVGVECRKSTRDVGMLHVNEEVEQKFVEMAAIINTLQEKLDEQTLSFQKPQTRDVAVMHIVDKINEEIEQRDVAINHRTDDEQHINTLLETQKEQITQNFIKELDILKQENCKLSVSLEEALRRQNKSVVTRGTHPIEQPQVYSIGCNTSRVQTRDVQVMYTPKCRDVALSTDRFNYTRDVNLYCNLDSYEELGNEQLSTLFELKKYGHIASRKRHHTSRDVCVGVNLMDAPKVMRDVKCGVNLDSLKELRDVAISCNFTPPKPQTRDVCMKVNLDGEKQLRDVCCGVDLSSDVKDASIFVNLIEPVKIPEHKHVGLQTAGGLTKDNQTNTDQLVSVQHKRDFASNVAFEDEEKQELKVELSKLRTFNSRLRHDVSTSMDYTHKLNASLIQNTSTGMDVPRVQSKFMNTDSVYTRETFTNTDFSNVSHKAIGDFDVNECATSGIDIREYNTIKSQLKFYEQQNQPKSVRTQGVGLCSIYDSVDAFQKPVAKTHSIAIGGGDIYEEEFLNVDEQRNIGPHVLSINVERPLKRKETEFEQRKVTSIDNGVKVVKEVVSMTSEDDCGNRVNEIWSTISGENDELRPKSVKQRAIDINTSSKLTSKVTVGNENSSNKTSITIPVTNKEFGGGDTILGASSSIAKNTIASLQYSQVPESTNQDEYATISTEEVLYKDGEVLDRNTTGKLEIKPKSILKTTTVPSNTTKALKFGGVIKGFHSASEESMGAIVDEIDVNDRLTTSIKYDSNAPQTKVVMALDGGSIVLPVHMELSEDLCYVINDGEIEDDCQEGDIGELEEIEEFETQEILSSIRDEESKDPNMHYDDEEDCDSLSSATDFELELELHIACAILNESLYEPLKADKNKVAKALNLIQQDWFKIAAQKNANPQAVMDHLNAFYSRFSNLLLERIVNMADMNLNTALHYSVSQGNFEIVNLLLDTKVCDVNAQNIAGYTSIMLAAVVPVTNEYERTTLKRLFSEGNVNIKSTDTCQTALMLAVRHGNKETVQLLLEASADVNLQDKDGSTALMAACEHGYLDIVRLLLDNSNCDPDIKDNDGENAFDIAKSKKRNDIIVLLYAHSSKLRSHHPALQFAKSRTRIGSGSSTSSQK